MNHFTTQLTLGCWFGLAVAAAILARSWEPFWSFGAVGCFVAVFLAAVHAMRSPRSNVRTASKAILAGFFLVMVAGLLLGVERVYVVNGSSYPAWLATADLGAVEKRILAPAPGCEGEPTEIYQKDNGLVVLRCGLLWYEGHTYLAHEQGAK